MNSKVIVIGMMVLLLGVGGFWWKTQQRYKSLTSGTGGSVKIESLNGVEKSFDLTVENFSYTPESIDVNLNDTVVLNITNRDSVQHGISLPVFGVNTFVAANSSTQVRFVADKLGNPETFCATDHGEKILINVEG